MYAIGDKIVCPMHGAGTIEAIEERTVRDVCVNYFVFTAARGTMKILIPCDNPTSIGVRSIIKKSEVIKVKEILKATSSEMTKIWNRRYRDNMEKLKTGSIMSVSEVVRDLMRVDCEKKLSTGEKKMLLNAKQILISELSLVMQKEESELCDLIERNVMSVGK
ncbi:MAG: CarD family transcriptional regulator [Clostridiales Family XIII bacterium]|nr:CarD family transcriptional regulator [Clostridiales Family XIII bacterium]